VERHLETVGEQTLDHLSRLVSDTASPLVVAEISYRAEFTHSGPPVI
jgi:hypothetical protein